MSYVDEVIDLVVKKNPGEPEFHQAVKEVQKRSTSGAIDRTGTTVDFPCAVGRR